MHEDFKPKSKVKVGSNRSFGLTFAAMFLLVGAWPWIRHNEPIRVWAIGMAVAFCFVAVVAPRLLAPLNNLWFRFGLLLHYIVTPIIMFLVFFGAVVPMGILIRLRGRDILHLSCDPNAKSYWVHRDPPPPDSMSKQF